MERDIFSFLLGYLILNFNSHAHVERDLLSFWFLARCAISTHTLTWSVTKKAYNEMTDDENFNSHAHVERDRNLAWNGYILTISTHTLTWSVTDRLTIGFNRLMISTHTLTWSVT